MNQELYSNNLKSCGGFEYYLKLFFGFIVHLILPGLEHFIIFQNVKAIALCISSFILRYILVTLASNLYLLILVLAIYYVNSYIVYMIWLKVTINIISILILGACLSNEISIFLDFNQLLLRLSNGYPIMKGEYTVQVLVLGAQFANPYFLTWLPIQAPKLWIDEVRNVDEKVRKGQ